MANLDTTNNVFTKSLTLNAQTGQLNLGTSGKFVDKNISIQVAARSATITLAAPASATISNLNIGYNSSAGNFSVTNSAAIGGTATLTVSQSGWIGTGTTAALNGNVTLSATIPKIGIKSTISGTAAVTPVISRTNTTASGAINVGTQTATTAAPTAGYFISVQSAQSKNTITAIPGVSSAGYGGTASGQWTGTNATASAGANASALTYIPIDAASATVAGIASANIGSVAITQTSGANTFDVAVTGNISGSTTVTLTQPGWLNSSINGTVSGTTFTSSAKINRVGVGATLSDKKMTPTLGSVSVPSGVTNAIDGNMTTSAPSSGVYIAVQSTSTTATITATPKVTTAGYGTTDNYAATNATATVGANASSVTYAKIKMGAGGADTASVSIAKYTTDGSNAGVNIAPIVGTAVTSEPTAGYYVAFSATGTGNSKITTAGWMNTGALATATANITRYFPVTTAVISVTGGGLTSGNGAVSMANKGYYNGSSYDSSDIIDITSQTSAASGYYALVATGSGSVNRAAINRQVTTAGYAPLDAAAVQQSAATSLSSNSATATYYVKKSTLSATQINSSNSNQTVTVSAGYYPSNRTITINKMSTYTPTTSYTYSGNMTTYFDSATSGNATLTITPRYTMTTAGYVAVASNSNNGGIGYWKIKNSTTSITAGAVSGTTFTQGKVTVNTGWVNSAVTVTGASFANSATSGITYLDISSTNQAPILISGDYLYINKGYTDNVKISLAKLVPDDATIEAYNVTSTNQILSGYAAYNSQGTLLSGTIPTNSADNMTVNNNTISITAGYYPEAVSKSVRNATLSYTGGALNNKGATASFSSNVTTTSTSNGISLTAIGQAGRAAVTYNSTTSGWVSVTSGGNVSSAVGATTWSGSTYYISGITVPKDIPFNLTTVADTALDNTSNITITNGAYRQINMTNNGNLSITSTGGTTTVVHGSSSSGSIIINAFNSSGTPALTGAKTIVSNGRWSTTSVAAGPEMLGPYYGEVYIKAASDMDKATVKSGSAVASLSNPTFNNEGGTGGQFTITASGDVNAPTVSSPGYISSTLGTKQANVGGISGTKNLTIVTLGTTQTSGNLTVAPTISRTAKPSGETWIDAASGAAVASASANTPYVRVDTNTATNELKIAGKVTAEGYGTTDHYNGSASTYNVGAAKAATRYIPIKVATTTKTNGTATASATSGTASIKTQPSASSTAIVTISSSMSTAGYSTTTTSDYSITINASATANSGVIQATGGNASASVGASSIQIGEGYITTATTVNTTAVSASKSGGTVTSTAATTSTSVSQTIYLKKAVIGGSITDATVTTTVAPGTVTIAKGAAVSGKTQIDITPTTASSGISTYFLSVKATAAANTTGATSSFSKTGNAVVTQEGYAPGGMTGIFSVSGSATAKTSSASSVDYYLPIATVGVGATISNGGARTPTISKQSVPSGVTDAASGNATTTAPTSGVYVAVRSAANTVTLTATPKVTTAGYGTTASGGYTAANATATVGAAQSALTYVPIKISTTTVTNGTATATATAGTASIKTNPSATSTATYTTSGITDGYYTNTTTSSYYITISSAATANSGVIQATGGSASASVGASSIQIGEGYVTTATSASTSASSTGNKTGNTVTSTAATATSSTSTTVYLKPAAASISGTNTATSPTIARTTTTASGAFNVASGNATTSTPASDTCYVSVQATAPATTISLTKTVGTKGFLATATQITGTSVSTSAKTGSIYYVPVKKATVTNTSGTATATATSGTASIKTNPSATSTATYTTSGITDGYYTNTTTSSYYITISSAATANSGVIQATGGSASASVGASTLSVSDGYVTTATTANTTAASASKTGGTVTSTAATATSSTSTTVYLKPAAASISGTNTATSPTIARTTTTASGAFNVANGNATTSTPASGTCFVSIQATAPATTISLTKTVGTKGFLATATQITGASVSTSAKTGSIYYVPIKKATVTNTSGTATATATAGTASVTTQPSASSTATYTTSGITDGYYTDTTTSSYSITVQSSATANSGVISATGGSASASVSASTLSISDGYVTTATTANTTASSTGNKTGNTVTTTAVAKNSTTSTTIYLKPAAATISGTNTATSPTIARTTTTASGAFNVASGNATTSTPASGTCFVSIQATAPATTISLTKTVNTKGFLAANTQISGASVSTSAKTGSIYYVPVKKATVTTTAATATATGGTASVSVTGMSTTSTNTGYSVSASATGGSASTTTGTMSITDGYLTAASTSTLAAKSASGTSSSTAIYIVKAVLGSEGSVTTAPSVTIGGTTNMTTATTGTYYFTRTGTASNGTVQTKYKATTAGYTPTVNATNGGTVTVTPSKTADATIYIPTAVVASEGSVSTTPTVAIGGTTNMTTATTGTYYFTRTGSVTNGTIQTKYKVTTAGYTPTKTATNSGTVSVAPTYSGNGTVYIPTAAGSVTMTKGNGSCTLQSSTNVTTSDTDTSGVAVTFRGSGSVSATAKITTAGYTPTNNSFATGASTASNTADLTKYITGVTIQAPPSGTTRTFNITVPNGNTTDYITFQFTVDSSGNVTVAGP